MATRRLELGFDAGTVVRVTVEQDAVEELTKVMASGAGTGWYELTTDDATCWVDVNRLRYVRIPSDSPRGVGFSEG